MLAVRRLASTDCARLAEQVCRARGTRDAGASDRPYHWHGGGDGAQPTAAALADFEFRDASTRDHDIDHDIEPDVDAARYLDID